jgi:hypothetical protein
MNRSSRAWILLPAILIVVAVLGVVLSNFQKEAGIADTNKGGPDAVSAALIARDYSTGESRSDYSTFAEALLFATVVQRDVPLMNAADTRLSHILDQALDCLYAAREAWQADIDGAWDPSIQGAVDYWQSLHPSLDLPSGSRPTAVDVRRLAVEQATRYLDQAIELVS